MMFKRNRFKITVEYSDHRSTRTRVTSVHVDGRKRIFYTSVPGMSEQLKVIIEKEK